MKRLLAIAVVLTAVSAAAQIANPGPPSVPRDTTRAASQLRTLTGQVVGSGGAPLPNSVVYLKNTKTLAVKTYIADKDGGFRFPGLAPNTDYEVFAEHNGRRSDTKTLSSFDTRPQANMILKIETK